jgi:vacuolar-type H+-ATPase subunit E/Vma4
MDRQIACLKNDLNRILNDPQDSIEEIQAKAAYVEERIKQLEVRRHTKVRDNIAAKFRLEGETLSKS